MPRLLAFAAFALLVPVAAADASTLSADSDSPKVFFHADPGERNRVEIRVLGDGLEIRDRGSTIAAGTGCEAIGPHRARCMSSAYFLRSNLGDEDDTLRVVDVGLAPKMTTIGGPGDDVLLGGDDFDNVWGGPGRDVIRGRASYDRLSGGPGADVIHGGPGEDTVSYESHRRDVSVDLARDVGGELDRITAIEHVVGGSGDDVIAGDERDNQLDGGAGRDRLIGRSGNDRFIRGGGGVACGKGIDHVHVNASSLDPIEFLALSCEWIDENPRLYAQAEVVRPRWVGWAISCPREQEESGPEICAPTIRLTETGGQERTLAEVTLRSAPWANHLVKLRLNRLGRRLLRQAPDPRITVAISAHDPWLFWLRWQASLR